MAILEIEVNDKGEIGTLPEAIQKFVDGKYNEAFGKGKAKAAEDAQKQIDAAVAKAREDERARLAKDGGDPAAIEKAKNLEAELSKLREDEAKREKNFEEAQRLRDERHAKALKEATDKHAAESEAAKSELVKRDTRIRELVDADIRVEAIKAGTRDASLDEVGELLSKYVLVGEDLRPSVDVAAFRKKFDGSKLGDDGKPVSLEGLVTEYLALKPHHKAPVSGKGGVARGGASLSGQPKTAAELEQASALAEVAENPSTRNVARALKLAGSNA